MKKNIFFSKLWVFVCVLVLSIGASAQNKKENIYVYKNGEIIYRAKAAVVDSVALEQNKTVVSIYQKDGTLLFTAPYAGIDSISYTSNVMAADLLDVRFTEDGQAYDASQMEMNVQTFAPDNKLDVKYNEAFKTYEAHFKNNWNADPTSYCKVDYFNNDYFKEKLSDGHTLETIFKASFVPPIVNAETKWFAAHEAGGTGFLITNKSGARQNEITFLPNVSTDGSSKWQWATSGVVPQPEVYYHVIGVWNKEEGKAYIYVNGELKNTIDAVGNLRLPPSEAAQWVGIACDANNYNGGQSGDWTIVRTRIYDKALNSYEAQALYDEVEDAIVTPQADLLDVVFNADGTAQDVSPMHNTVETIAPDNAVPTYLNANYGCYAAKIKNNWGTGGSLGDAPTYFKVDYAENQAFKDALASGHSIETVFKASYQGVLPNAEAKWFASHQAGGTGFLISKVDNNAGRQNEITFLPNVSTDGSSKWKWANSGVVPESETYYHVVGVWNKEEGKAYVYVNGELKNTVDAVGDLRFPSAGANWFGIGCDANGNNGENGGDWEIVRARVYGSPLTSQNVSTLWGEIYAQTIAANDSVKRAIEEEQIPEVEAPKADILDVIFKADGSAEDVSPMKNEVISVGENFTTYYNNTYKRYVARFNNPMGGRATEYYRVNYGNNEKFYNALADGHTMECVVMGDYDGNIPGGELKYFSSHQAGGTGLMVTNEHELAYLPNVSTNGGSNWRFARTGVVPTSKTYYHIVGVWNKEEGKAYVYLNGELRTVTDAAGDLHFPPEVAHWFAIGGDPQNEICEQAWCGDVVLARIYDAPLDMAQAKALWKQVSELQEAAPQIVKEVTVYDKLMVEQGGKYPVKGKGFTAGDKIVLTSLDGTDVHPITLDAEIVSDGVNVVIPDDFKAGRYVLSVKRGENVQDIQPVRIQITDQLPAGSKVIAHRGYWNTPGAAQNSIASVKNAINNKFYGAEIDVWLTTDGHLMVNHDAALNGVTIEKSTYDQCKNLKLSNGENIPELKDILALFTDEVETKLIIEIKNHSTADRTIQAAKATYDAVWEALASEKVEYISFSKDACTELAKLDDSNKVAYLNGDLSPKDANDLGIKGLDYTAGTFRNNPSWIEEAHNLGMYVNVWTLNTTADIIDANNWGVDFITTDNPVTAESVRKLYASDED